MLRVCYPCMLCNGCSFHGACLVSLLIALGVALALLIGGCLCKASPELCGNNFEAHGRPWCVIVSFWFWVS